MMFKKFIGLATTFSAAVLLAACSNMTEYEKQVQDWEPVYCYKSLASVQCYKEPKHSDSRRLVNFYGPAPREYDEPDTPVYSTTRPPKMIDTWVKDPEPVPEAAPMKAHIATPEPTKAADTTLKGDEDVSFMDGMLRSLFGKPKLANKPVQAASAPVTNGAVILQPAPAAQPVIPVQTGTL